MLQKMGRNALAPTLRCLSGGKRGAASMLLVKQTAISHTNRSLQARLFSAQANAKSSLFEAAESGTVGTIKDFLDSKALGSEDVSAIAEALILAAKAGHANVIKMLLAAGAEADAADENGKAALIIASENGHVEAVQALLEAGANIEAIDKGRNSALHRAAKEGHAGVVAALLEGGAKVNTQDKTGRTALMVARKKEVKELLEGRGGRAIGSGFCAG